MKWAATASVLCLAIPGSLMIAHAQDYPGRPVKIIVPQPAGSTPDMVARLVSPGLANVFGQQFIIDNRGGAGGMLGTEIAAKSPADGYTLLMGTPGTLTIMPHVQKNIPYETLRDFAPIALISVGHYVVVTHPSVPIKSVQELLAYAKAHPGKLDYASAGNGSTNHLAMEIFKSMAHVNILHVPYKGAPQATTDLLGGHVSMSMLSIGPLLPHIAAGRVRVLAVTSMKRIAQLPDVPTVNESGVRGYEAFTWFGMLAPARTPPAIVARVSEALTKILRTPEMRDQFTRRGTEASDGTPASFGEMLRKETETYGKLVKQSGMRVD